MRKIILNCWVLAFILMILPGCKHDTKLFVGGFTTTNDKGLSIFDFNSRTGELSLISTKDIGPEPSYIAYNERNKLFYSLNEVSEFKGAVGAGLTTYRYDEANDTMKLVNELLIPYGGSCYISMSPDSGFLLIANYPKGSVVVVKLNDSGIPVSVTDTILYNKESPEESHAHMISSDPAGRRIYVTDLGMDMIRIYDLDSEAGKLNMVENGSIELPLKSGPRHFVFNDEGSKMYVINELGRKVMVFDVNDNDGLKLLQTIPSTRIGYEGENFCADIHMSKDGRFIYGSNRGENSIVTYSIGSDGLLTLVGHTTCGGNWPRNFTLDPTGNFILVGNQKSDNISVFKINRTTGLPDEESEREYFSVMPACLKFYN